MSYYKNQDDELDSFWDLSRLIPEKRDIKKKSIPVVLQDIVVDGKFDSATPKDELRLSYAEERSENAVIEKIITEDGPCREAKKYESVISYKPENSLLHEVYLKKKVCSFDFYEEFLKDAQRYLEKEVEKADPVSFFSYVPQYNQLNPAQLNFYLYWRSNVRKGIFECVDYSYILLYIYELINTSDETNALDNQIMLTELWNNYAESYPAIAGRLISWICDLSLIYKLLPPPNMKKRMVSSCNGFKEFFISVPNGDYDLCARTLLKYCSSYDYRKSKFAQGENLKVYDDHVFGAVCCAVDYYSENGKILFKLSSEDSRLVREAFSGALCSKKMRYDIDISYCSFSRSNELRFLVGDVVKYAENKIRELLGIKSKLTVYSVPTELKEKIDAYFKSINVIPSRKKKKEEVHEYDVLYDVPVKKFSLSDALKIENASWDTTNELITAFEDTAEEDVSADKKESFSSEAIDFDVKETESDLNRALGELLVFVEAIKAQDKEKMAEYISRSGKMLDSIVDEVNEIASDVIGDILLEDDGDGNLSVIDCYADMI